jgi:hypothetical protein
MNSFSGSRVKRAAGEQSAQLQSISGAANTDRFTILRYTNLPLGPQPSTIEVDLDMLSPDFYTVQTTSGEGSQYNVFSNTHGKLSPR